MCPCSQGISDRIPPSTRESDRNPQFKPCIDTMVRESSDQNPSSMRQSCQALRGCQGCADGSNRIRIHQRLLQQVLQVIDNLLLPLATLCLTCLNLRHESAAAAERTCLILGTSFHVCILGDTLIMVDVAAHQCDGALCLQHRKMANNAHWTIVLWSTLRWRQGLLLLLLLLILLSPAGVLKLKLLLLLLLLLQLLLPPTGALQGLLPLLLLLLLLPTAGALQSTLRCRQDRLSAWRRCFG